MGRIVFQCYPPVSEVPMTSALARRPFPLIPLALLAACNTETSNERVLGIQAMSFANSEWSEPVHLDAPINSRCQDQTPTMSKDERSLYFLSDRPGRTRKPAVDHRMHGQLRPLGRPALVPGRPLGNGCEPGPDDQHRPERGWSCVVARRSSALLFERPRYDRHTPRHLRVAPRRSEGRLRVGPANASRP